MHDLACGIWIYFVPIAVYLYTVSCSHVVPVQAIDSAKRIGGVPHQCSAARPYARYRVLQARTRQGTSISKFALYDLR